MELTRLETPLHCERRADALALPAAVPASRRSPERAALEPQRHRLLPGYKRQTSLAISRTKLIFKGNDREA